MPFDAFRTGLLPMGVLAGSRVVIVAIFACGTWKLDTSTEFCDSVDLRFFDRVGAIFA